MIVGYILIGAVAGLLASAVALLLGASFWLALGLYTLVGSAAVIVVTSARMIAGVLVVRAKAATVTDRWKETDNLRPAETSTSQRGTVIDTSMRILAVDDDPFILELIPMISAKAEFSEVTPAASGGQALDLLASSDVMFDCLLIDISMPDMDGVELCQRVRQIPQYRQTPIIMLTAMRDMTNMGDAYRAGATDYVTKPFEIEELASRLRLAQEATDAKRETGLARHEDSGTNWGVGRNHGFELPVRLPLEGVEALVDHTVLSNYLTQLPRKEVAGVHVFAIILDGIEVVHTQTSPRQFAALLKDVAAAAANSFGVDQTVMAYTNNATLLITVNSGNPMPAINIEIDVERWLLANISGHDTGEGTEISVSVGGPVQLQGAKAERARMATDHVIALAENRAFDKQGRQIAGLFRR